MKTSYLILGILLSTLYLPVHLLNAQITIGSHIKPIEGALLDLKEQTPSSDNITAVKGLLLPRVNLSEPDQLYPMFEAGSAPDKYKFGTQELDKTNEDPVHTGLTVYNLTDDCLFCPGVYTWTGIVWNKLGEACCPCLFSVTSGGTLHQSVYLGETPTLGAVTANYSDGGTHDTAYQWYINTSALNTGGTAIAEAPDHTHILLPTRTSATGTYYFYCVATNTCNNKSMASDVYTVEVTDPCAGVAVTGTTDGSVCGSGTVTLAATASSGSVIRWYDAATGGNLLQTGTGGTDIYITGNLSVTTTYWVEAYNATYNCVSPKKAVVATVNEIPAAPTGAVGASVCQNTTASLSVTAPTGCTIDWYDAATGGSMVASGTNPFTTPSLSATKIYYAEARNATTGCRSVSRLAVTATVILPPSITATPSGTTLNANGATTVTASATPSTGATIRWFDVATGGTSIGTGNTYQTSPDCADKYVYAEAYNSCGVSTRTPYTVVGVQVKLHGTVTISRIDSFNDHVSVTFSDNTLPAASWATMSSNRFTWLTPTITVNPNTYTSRIGMDTSAGSFWWTLRGYFGGCAWELQVESDGAWRAYTYTLSVGSSTLTSGTFNTNSDGVRTSFSF
ncbi:MAG: hypothetical protein LBV43_08490 [Prevotella sp.]|nr:hypothetical protein [Prevotella sp.]